MLKGLRRRLAIVFTAFTGVVLAGALVVSYYLAARQTVADNETWFSSTVDTVAQTLVTSAASDDEVVFYTGPYVVSLRKDGQPLPNVAAQSDGAQDLSPEAADALFQQAKAVAEEQQSTTWVVDSYQVAFGTSPVMEDIGEAVAGQAAAEADADTATGDAAEAAQAGEPGDVAVDAAPGAAQDTASEAAAEEGTLYWTTDPSVVAVTMSTLAGTEGIFTMRAGDASYRATYFSWPLEGADYEAVVLEDLAKQNRALLLTGLLYAVLLLGGLALLYLINWFLARLILRPTEEGLQRQTEFVAAASHELRSPLAVIRSSLSAAQAAPGGREAEKFQAAAAQEAERMTRLVDDLLLLAGGDAGSWKLHPEPVDLDTLLIDAAEVYRPLARQRGVGLVLDLPGETLPQVKGDAERLRQILAVLLDNALQYAPAGTDITLSAGTKPAGAKRGKVRISVADRGRGIPDAEKEKVFQRFYQADESRHDKEHFGLGLSVAQELAQLHGGSLAVADTGGGGATFTLALPAK